METSSIDGIMLDFVADQQSQFGNNNPLSKIEQMWFFGDLFFHKQFYFAILNYLASMVLYIL